MDLPEVAQQPAGDEAELRAWDWRAEAKRQDRTILWVARRAGIPYQTGYRIARGDQVATLEQLRAIAIVLGRTEQVAS